MTAARQSSGEHTIPPGWIRLLRSPWPRFVIFAILLGALGWFALAHGSGTVEIVRAYAARLGVAGAIAFVVIYAVVTLAPLPATLLSAAAGVLYGPLLGVLVVWSGAVLGAATAFLLGRMMSRAAVEQLAHGRMDQLNVLLTARGTMTVLLIRLVPVFPFTLVNYGSAVTALTLRQYLVGTAVGILPSTIAYVAVGGSIDDPTSPVFLTAIVALVLLTVGGAVGARRYNRGGSSRNGDAGER